jgi:hypothetical protein
MTDDNLDQTNATHGHTSHGSTFITQEDIQDTTSQHDSLTDANSCEEEEEVSLHVEVENTSPSQLSTENEHHMESQSSSTHHDQSTRSRPLTETQRNKLTAQHDQEIYRQEHWHITSVDNMLGNISEGINRDMSRMYLFMSAKTVNPLQTITIVSIDALAAEIKAHRESGGKGLWVSFIHSSLQTRVKNT